MNYTNLQSKNTFDMYPNKNNKTQYEKSFINYLKKGINPSIDQFQGINANDLIAQDPLNPINNTNANGFPITEKMDQIIAGALKVYPIRKYSSYMKSSQYLIEVPVYQNYSNIINWSDGRTFANPIEDIKHETISLHDLTANIMVTSRLVNDNATDIETTIANHIAESFQVAENEAFLNGDGNEKPLGLLNHPLIESINSTTNQISFDDLLKLYSLLDSKYESSNHEVAFIMSKKTGLKVRSLKDSSGRFIFQNNSFSNSAVDSLFGIPMYLSSIMPDNKILLLNIKQAHIIVEGSDNNGMISNIRIEVDSHTARPFIKYAATQRIGSSVLNPNAAKLLQIIN